ncbi:MAG: uncharacterized protein H6Q75_1375 [Firmicutes bacterium]|nr:uncharacterized protein [Bacillota bacterium]
MNNTFPDMVRAVDLKITQAVLVEAKRGEYLAGVSAWEYKNNSWQKVYGPFPATIGKGGIIAPEHKREGDGCTPTGVYPLGMVFGSRPFLAINMPYRQVTEEDFWVDDPDSSDYNLWVRGRPGSGTYEEMLREDGLYNYGIVVEYNTAPVVPGKGSAIFMHLWKAPDQPTRGCVAMDQDSLVKLIGWLDPVHWPVIAIPG